MKHPICNNKGFGLLEILITSAILAASIIALSAAAEFSLRVTEQGLKRTQGIFLAEEALEVVRLLRDESWSAHIDGRVLNTLYYPRFNADTSAWALETDEPPGGAFVRAVEFGDVFRRTADSEIVEENSPGTKMLDPGTKKVVARVSWESSSMTVETYITNLFQN